MLFNNLIHQIGGGNWDVAIDKITIPQSTQIIYSLPSKRPYVVYVANSSFAGGSFLVYHLGGEGNNHVLDYTSSYYGTMTITNYQSYLTLKTSGTQQTLSVFKFTAKD